jgi:hypothetical protein
MENSRGPVVVRANNAPRAVGGDYLRHYRDTTFLLNHVLTSGGITAGHFAFTNATALSSITYSFTSTMLAAATGLESSQSSALSVTAPASTLATPSAFAAARATYDYSTANLSWNTSVYPMGVKFTIESSTTNSTSGFSVIASNVSGSSYRAAATPAQTWYRIKAVLAPRTASAYAWPASARTTGRCSGQLSFPRLTTEARAAPRKFHSHRLNAEECAA